MCAFRCSNEDGQEAGEDLLVWTTTPWTLPSNQFAAVHPELEYSVVSDPENRRSPTDRRRRPWSKRSPTKVKRELKVERTVKGTELVGRRYLPPFRLLLRQTPDWQIGGRPVAAAMNKAH